jgi:amidohydrolase
MAALVALTRAAHALGEALPVGLLAVFQPSEEAYPSGAEELARNQLKRLAPSAVLAAHIHPELRWGAVALDPGAVNASSDSVEITVHGEPSHGAYPHHARDPILAIAQIVLGLSAEASRRIDPLHAAVVNVGVLEGGRTENVIPAHARARASLRALQPEDRQTLRRLVDEVAHGTAAAHGCTATVELTEGEPALSNDPGIVARARALLADAGLARAPEWRSAGSDDFAFFGALAPLAMAFVGLDGAEGFVRRPLHHPELLVPDSAVGAVARTLAVLYVAASGV